ncbi:MAG: FTR1 family iron permease [Solirubrobacterales bacterium]
MLAALALLGAIAAPAPAAPGGTSGQQAAPWRSADQLRADLFAAQTALLLGESAGDSLAAATGRLSGPLAAGLRREAPADLRRARKLLAEARRAGAAGDPVALAAARGALLATLRRGAFAVAVAAARAGDVPMARSWLLIRDFRQTTRFTRPGATATVALEELAAGEISPAEAAAAVRKDLLDAYQARLGTNLEDAVEAAERGFDARLAESAAIAAGYWRILEPVFREEMGASRARRPAADFEAIAAAAAASARSRIAPLSQRVSADLEGFVAAPLTPEEEVRRANQLTRFLDLVPIEYDDGTEDGRVTIPFELQEAVAFLDGAEQALDDLEGPLLETDPDGVATVRAAFARLARYTSDAHEGRRIVPLEQVEAAHARASETLEQIFPGEWKESSDEADYDLVEISLDQLEAAVSAGERGQAEQARLSAYAFFEFGPELKLRAFDPGLVAEIEGLVWYGAGGNAGLAQLIADGAPIAEVRETRAALQEALDTARAKTGEGASDGTVITNAALIVFREGLEAILIIAAITASLIGARRHLRRPVFRGALLAIPASIALWFASLLLLDSLSGYGEKLEAVVGVIAIGVLLVILNWFFHRVYWTEWIAGHRKRGKDLSDAALGGAVAGATTIAGLYILGFSSVLREGVETVLFLQALQLSSGTGVVLAGVGLASVGVALVGLATFRLEQRLPYKKMLIVTGVLIALVLVVLVGNTMRTLQGVGWLPITPLDVEFPLWMGTWLGFFPTVETLGAQGLALLFVIGSYFLAEWVRKRHLHRALAQERAEAEAGSPVMAEAESTARAEAESPAATGNGRPAQPVAGNGRPVVRANGSSAPTRARDRTRR